MSGTPQARAPEQGTGPKERVAGPRGMDPLGPVPEYFSLDDSPLLGQRYKNPICFVQCCNFAMYFMQPFHFTQSPWS